MGMDYQHVVSLGNGRYAWFFQDTFIDPGGSASTLRQSHFAHNAVLVQDVRGRYATLGVQAEILPFVDDMAARLAASDLVVCRAGAITVSELCVAGVPSVHPVGADNVRPNVRGAEATASLTVLTETVAVRCPAVMVAEVDTNGA